MKANTREFTESPLFQGRNESKPYSVTTTPWGTSPASVVVNLYLFVGGDPQVAESWEDVTSTNTTGSASVVGDVITLPAIAGLAAGSTYRLEVKWTAGGQTDEGYGIIYGQR